MSDGFDPYAEWLQVHTDRRPPTHYDLLGLSAFEADAELMHKAVMERTAQVRRYQLGQYGADSLRLQSELSRAFNCLRAPEEKQRYDAALRGQAGLATLDRESGDKTLDEEPAVWQGPTTATDGVTDGPEAGADELLPPRADAIQPLPIRTQVVHAACPRCGASVPAGSVLCRPCTDAVSDTKRIVAAASFGAPLDVGSIRRPIAVLAPATVDGNSSPATGYVRRASQPRRARSWRRMMVMAGSVAALIIVLGGLLTVGPRRPAELVYTVNVTPPESTLSVEEDGVHVRREGGRWVIRVPNPDGKRNVTVVAKCRGYAQKRVPLSKANDIRELRVVLKKKPISWERAPGPDLADFLPEPPPENLPPTVTIAIEPDSPEAGASLTFRLVGDDPEGGPVELEYRIFIIPGNTPGRREGAPVGQEYRVPSPDPPWNRAADASATVSDLKEGRLTLEARARDGEGKLSPIAARTVDVKPAPPPAKNQLTTLKIASVEPKSLEAGDSLVIVVEVSDSEGDEVTIEYRTDSKADWRAAHDGRVTIRDLKAGPLTLEFRARDGDSRVSKVLTRTLEVKATVLSAPTIGLLWQGRRDGAKEAALGRYGGTAEGEAAVTQGLQWLVKQQRKDGSWSLKGPYSSPSLEPRDIAESATAMALLAIQGHGSTHKSGPFQKSVARGVKALLKLQQEDGNFFTQDDGRPHNWLYTHAQCTIAICELYGMTRDPALRRPTELAVKFCVDAQDPDLGGWRYSPRVDSDTSVTGWMVIALQSAKMAGLDVPGTTWAKVSEYLDKATVDGSRYGYQVGMEHTVSMTAEALLCRQFLGWRQDDPRLVEGAEVLLKHLPDWGDRDVYYWYYATQTMHHMEGKYWTAWNATLRDMLIEHRETKGQEKGSWDPLGRSPDRWANLGQGGRLYVTCLSLYMLEVYYRHLPIYEMRKLGAK